MVWQFSSPFKARLVVAAPEAITWLTLYYNVAYIWHWGISRLPGTKTGDDYRLQNITPISE